MSPFDFIKQYHDFSVSDGRLGLTVNTTISGYNNRYSLEGAGEMLRVTSNLASKYNRGKPLDREFVLPNEDRVDSGETFTLSSLQRAFQSRGSPDEFADALRLAFLAGRCGVPGQPSPGAYASKWFTNDCVSFAGNYSGVSPSTPVFAYAEGLTEAMLRQPGVAADLRLCASLVHLPPRGDAEDIAPGDLVLTFAKPDARGIAWRHIAVVEDFALVSATQGRLSMAEWGWNVVADHTVRGKIVQLHDGSGGDRGVAAQLRATRRRFRDGGDVVAFNGTAPGPDRSPALRIFFDASAFADIESRGWRVAGKAA